MFGVEKAIQKGWNHLWIECDSQLAIQAFKNKAIVPWSLRNRWGNMLKSLSKIRYVYSHIYIYIYKHRESNVCADKLANYGIGDTGLTWWNTIPNFIREDYFLDRISFPKYSFC